MHVLLLSFESMNCNWTNCVQTHQHSQKLAMACLVRIRSESDNHAWLLHHLSLTLVVLHPNSGKSLDRLQKKIRIFQPGFFSHQKKWTENSLVPCVRSWYNWRAGGKPFLKKSLRFTLSKLLELSHQPRWNSRTLYQLTSISLADPSTTFPTKIHITWVHATLHHILAHITALETHLYDMSRILKSTWPGPPPCPPYQGEQTGTNTSFLFLLPSSVSRHRALSCCPRRKPSPCHWSSLTDVSNVALLSWIFNQVSLLDFESFHLISHTWQQSCPILSFRIVKWGHSVPPVSSCVFLSLFPPVCVFLSLYCSTCRLLRRYALALSWYNWFFCTTLVWGMFPWLFFHIRVERGRRMVQTKTWY